MNERLKLVRKTMKLSQEEFGKRLGVTGPGISKIESGDRGVTEQMLLSVCRTFSVNRDWLETGEGEMFLSGDGELYDMIDRLMDGENDFAKAVFKEFTKFSDEDWKHMEQFCKNVIESKKKEPKGN